MAAKQDGGDADPEGILGLVRETADGLGRLVGEHIKLARLELLSDAKAFTRRIAMLAVFVPCLLVGYGILCLAGAALLGLWIPMWTALLTVAGVNLLCGAWGTAFVLRALPEAPASMDETKTAVERSVAMLVAAGRPDPGRVTEGRHA